MKRRRIVTGALAATIQPFSHDALAQDPRRIVRKVGVLAPSTRAKEEATLAPFYDEMRRIGWIEGGSIEYDRAYGDDRAEVLTRAAAELVARAPQVIYAPPQSAAVAARAATRTIPIVFATGSDPIGAGLVASLARPGGNVTGIVTIADSLGPKRLDLVREALPAARRIGYIGDRRDTRAKFDLAAIRAVAPDLGFTMIVAEGSNPAQTEAALTRLLAQKVDVVLTGSTLAGNLAAHLAALASTHGVPVVATRSQAVEGGALFAYGGALDDQLRRSAHLVDKVLNGVQPADIPVEQPNRFELVVNRRVAGALGIALPPAFLLRVDRVIE